MEMRTSMGMKTILLASALLFPALSFAQNLSFKEIESRVLEYRNWLDHLGSNGSKIFNNVYSDNGISFEVESDQDIVLFNG